MGAKFLGSLHEGIPVKDAEASLKFYTEVLGLKVLPRPSVIGPGYWLADASDTVQFHLIQERQGHPAWARGVDLSHWPPHGLAPPGPGAVPPAPARAGRRVQRAASRQHRAQRPAVRQGPGRPHLGIPGDAPHVARSQALRLN